MSTTYTDIALGINIYCSLTMNPCDFGDLLEFSFSAIAGWHLWAFKCGMAQLSWMDWHEVVSRGIVFNGKWLHLNNAHTSVAANNHGTSWTDNWEQFGSSVFGPRTLWHVDRRSCQPWTIHLISWATAAPCCRAYGSSWRKAAEKS